MKRKDQTVEEMIMKSHYLNALEIESGADKPLCDMEREVFLETIHDLKESILNANEMIRSLQDTIRTLQSELARSRFHSDRYETQNTDLRSVIDDLRNQLSDREKEISDLRDLNNRHNKMTFGTKSTSRKHKRPSQNRGREEEKEECDGPDATSSDKAESQQPEERLDKTKVKSEHLDSKRGPRSSYTQMDAAKKSSLRVSWKVYRQIGCLTASRMLMNTTASAILN